MVRFAEALRPSAIMMEQVPAFLKAEAANSVTVLGLIQESFWAVGYETRASILNAYDSGAAAT